jgi:hypothetical protein
VVERLKRVQSSAVWDSISVAGNSPRPPSNQPLLAAGADCVFVPRPRATSTSSAGPLTKRERPRHIKSFTVAATVLHFRPSRHNHLGLCSPVRPRLTLCGIC